MKDHRPLARSTLLSALALITACTTNPSHTATPEPEENQMRPLDGYVEVNGARLYYEARVPADAATKTPIVLVHGLSLASAMWDAEFDALSQRWPTYRFDLRGHGKSSPADGPVALHEDLLGFLDALNLPKAHLVGLSLGGNAVTELATTHPERVGKLVLIDSGINGFDYPTPNVLQRIPGYLEMFQREGWIAALEAWLEDPLFAVSYQDDAVRQALAAIVLECPCSLFFSPQLQIRPDTYNRLHSVTASTLVLVGELDTGEFQAASRALHRLISGSTLQVIEGAGHMANMDRPDAVLAAISQFLADAE